MAYNVLNMVRSCTIQCQLQSTTAQLIMSDKLKELEDKIAKLEKQVAINKIEAEKDKTKYPVYTDGKMWVSATHWYYN